MAPEQSPQRPWLAAVLTIAMPGLGHMYNGQWKRGLIIYGIQVVFVALLLPALLLIRPMIPFNLLLAVILLVALMVFWIMDAVKGARSAGEEYPPSPMNRWYTYAGIWVCSTFILLPLVSSLVKANLVESYVAPTGTMENTIMVGDYMIGDKRHSLRSDVEPGDVVLFSYPHNPEEKYVKRLIAGPGQTVEIREREPYVDGIRQQDPEGVKFVEAQPWAVDREDPNIWPRGNGNKDNYGLVRVPARGDTLTVTRDRAILWYVAMMDGHLVRHAGNQTLIDGVPADVYHPEQDYYFMMGDNRDQSFDSRHWGFVPQKHLLGEALFVYFSRYPSRIGKSIR